MAKVRAELAQWIEADVIADAILDELKAYQIKPTLKNAKAVWLDVLENELPYAIASSVKARFSP